MIIAGLLFSGHTGYTEGPTKVVTLNECINIALQNNSLIKASDEDKKKAAAEYRIASAQRLPFINAEIKTNQYPRVAAVESYEAYVPYIASQDAKNAYILKKYKDSKKPENFFDKLSKYYTIGLSMSVSAGISLYNEKANRLVESMRTGKKLSNAQSRKVIGDVILNVKKSYYSYILSRENVKLRESILKYNEDRYKVTHLLYKNAQKQIFDLSKATVDLNDAQLELQKSKNLERSSRLDLLRTLGVDDPGGEIELEKNDEISEINYSVDQLIKLADLNYPDMQIARLQKELSRVKVAMETGGHYPEVNLQMGVGYENGQLEKNFFDSSNWRTTGYIGFIARLNLYSGGMVKAKIDSAVAEYNKTVYREKDVAMNVQMTIQSNMVSLQELAKQLNTSKIMRENADKHLKLAKKMYDSGSTTILELHDANMSRATAELNYLRTKFDYMMTIARISSFVGLGEDALCKK
jgi:outer membrane protein